MRRDRFAFTLIELLVVIAIIALLLGILIPVLAEARNSSRRVICFGNLRQIGAAYASYLNTYEGVYPFQDDSPMFTSTVGDPLDDCARRGLGWTSEVVALKLAPFLGDPLVWEQALDADGNLAFDRNGCPQRLYTATGVFACPSDAAYLKRLGSDASPFSFEYSWSFYTDPKVVNQQRSQVLFGLMPSENAPQRASNVAFTSKKILYGETSDHHDLPGEGTTQNWFDPVGSRNFLFADGHANRHEMQEIRLTNMEAFTTDGGLERIRTPHATIDGVRGYDLD